MAALWPKWLRSAAEQRSSGPRSSPARPERPRASASAGPPALSVASIPVAVLPPPDDHVGVPGNRLVSGTARPSRRVERPLLGSPVATVFSPPGRARPRPRPRPAASCSSTREAVGSFASRPHQGERPSFRARRASPAGPPDRRCCASAGVSSHTAPGITVLRQHDSLAPPSGSRQGITPSRPPAGGEGSLRSSAADFCSKRLRRPLPSLPYHSRSGPLQTYMLAGTGVACGGPGARSWPRGSAWISPRTRQPSAPKNVKVPL